MIQAAEPWLGLDWKVMGILIGLITTIVGAMLGLIYKLIVNAFNSKIELFDEKVASISKEFSAAVEHNSQFDRERMNRLVESLSEETKKREDLEKDYRKHLADLPRDFVQRIDWIREFNKVDAKLDAIWKKVSETREDVAKKGTAK